MGVPTSEVGYTIAKTRRETTQVHKNMWWLWRKKNPFHIYIYIYIYAYILYMCGPGSSVGIATDYGLDGPGSNPHGDEIFHLSRPALGPTL
jgi:hypothetical protein